MTITPRDLACAGVGALLVLSGLVWLAVAVLLGLALGAVLASSMTVEQAGAIGRRLRTVLAGWNGAEAVEPPPPRKPRQRSRQPRQRPLLTVVT